MQDLGFEKYFSNDLTFPISDIGIVLVKHPSIYQIATNQDGTKTYTRVDNLDSSPYYRWDNSVLPRTEAFPPEFRMIAYSDQDGADVGGENGGNLFTECCDIDAQGEESCTITESGVNFPKKNCDFLGMAFGMFMVISISR